MGKSGAYPYRIRIVNVDGTGLFTLDEGPAAMMWQHYSWLPDIWSRDGRSIVCVRREGEFWTVYVVDTVDGRRTQITNGLADDLGARFNVHGDIIFQTARNGNWDMYIAFSPPQCRYRLAGDLNNDCIVDFHDLAIMFSNWLVDCTHMPDDPACIPQ